MSAFGTYPLTTRAGMTMVLVDPGASPTSLALPGIVDVLAKTIVSELDDLAWVLHVVEDDGSLPPPSTPPTQIRVPSSVSNLTVYVHDQLEQFCATWGLCFDHVLIETSGVNPAGAKNAQLWWAMSGLRCTSSVNYLIDAAQQWDQLPSTLALLPADVKAAPVALLGPMPEAHVVRTLIVELIQIINSSTPVDDAQTWFAQAYATHRFRRWFRRWRAVVSQIYSSTRHMPEPWPLDAVRLRFEGDPVVVSPPVKTNVQSYGRWARMVTDRRVGVAIGGAGAQSYVGIPFIQKLENAGVPIDILSGASTGAFITAFYAAIGDRGLLRMLLNSNTIGWGVFIGMVDNIPLTWWLAWGTQFADFTDLAQPTICVSSVAQTGEAWYQTAGLAGKGLMASGSLPPFVATYIGNTRLLDGGPTADLPTAILSAAGAQLVLAAQPVPQITQIPRLPDSVPVPYLTKFALTLNPMVRFLDYFRAYLMLFRQAALGQEQYAEVSYNATTKFTTAGSWYAGQRIAHDAANSPGLQDAIADAKLHWQALLDDAPARVRINLGTNEVEIGPAVHVGFEAAPGGGWRLTPDSELILAELGPFVASSATALAVTLVDVPASIPHDTLFQAASGLSSAQLSYTAITTVPGAPPTFSLNIVP